jgi:hypothetical protein
MQNINVNQSAPGGYTPAQTRAAFNQAMGKAHAEADMRYNMKPLDKAGMSRAPGGQYMAGIASAQNLADGVAAAYGGTQSDAVSNAGTDLASQGARESLGLGVSAVQQQAAYAQALAALQRQQASSNFQTGILGGLLGNIGSATKSGGTSTWMDNFLGY